jgi:excisionase family DNA binding protein
MEENFPMLTVRQAAKTLGVHETTIRRLANRGKLKAYRNYLGWRLFDPRDVAGVRQELSTLKPEPVPAPEGTDA